MSDYSRVARSARWSDVRDRVLRGAVAGAALGSVALLVGLARFAWAVFRGFDGAGFERKDLVGMLLYVGGFTAAGALVGALWNLRRRRGGPVILGLIAAGTVALAIGTFESGSILNWDGAAWFAWGLVTLFFGILLGPKFFGSSE